MTSIPSLVKDDFEDLKFPTQIDFLGDSYVNRALTTVAQEVARLIQQAYPSQADSINHPETIAQIVIEPEYRHIAFAGLSKDRIINPLR